MLSAIFFLLCLSHVGLFLWTRQLKGAGFPLLFLRCLLLTLAFDNLVVGLGPYLLPSGIYDILSTLRFWGHAILLPLLLVFVASAWCGFTGSGPVWPVRLAWMLAGLAIAYGYFFDLASLSLAPAEYYPRLVATDGQPPYATIIVNLLVVIAGAWVWRRASWPWLFLGALQIFVINGALAGREWGFIAGNAAELLFAVSLLGTLKRVMNLQGHSTVGPAGSISASLHAVSIRPGGRN